MPATIIHGEFDATVPAILATATAEAIPGAALHILEGQGHFTILEAPERLNPLLADALVIPKELVPAR